MSNDFRELLKKIGSGTHTGKNLTQEEADLAMELMLLKEATPAQIGAFLIAHRIKRPTGEELAGMLDAYSELGPKLSTGKPGEPQINPVVFGCPYDGRSRTAPVTPITALILATAGVNVLMHGGDRIPTKEGLPLIEIWQGLGVDWTKLELIKIQEVLLTTGLGFIYLTKHFPLAYDLITYRREIGKRPPLATMELMWSPFIGKFNLVCGYVHPPTETLFCEAFQLRNVADFTTVKGLEGSCDLPRDRTAIIGLSKNNNLGNQLIKPAKNLDEKVQRLLLDPHDYGFSGKEVPLNSTEELLTQIQGILHGKDNQLSPSVIWNAGFYLWRFGATPDLKSGFSKAEELLKTGLIQHKLAQVIAEING
jgi:anthranilate phosphoribosyltransferase